jgi:hypothetical protein
LGDGLRVGRVALRAITLANCLTDLYQWRAELHFDNAPDRAAIYALWRRGLYAQVVQAVALSAPTPGAATHPRNWRRALWAFGRATHILQDFYAHTNWVELAVERGQWQAIAPLHAPDCAAHDLPAGLTSGYFSLRYAAPWQQFSGCPACDGQFVPPPGFAYCHAQLAKSPPARRWHSARAPAGLGPKFIVRGYAAACMYLAEVRHMPAARRIPGAPTRPHGWYQAERSRELAGFFWYTAW